MELLMLKTCLTGRLIYLAQKLKGFANIPDCNILISHTPPFDAANTGSVLEILNYLIMEVML